MSIVIIDDAPINQHIARRRLRDMQSVAVPETPEQLLALPDDATLIFYDVYMGQDWTDAMHQYIGRNPKAEVVEWSAGGNVSDKKKLVAHATAKIVKTGLGDELVTYIQKRGV